MGGKRITTKRGRTWAAFLMSSVFPLDPDGERVFWDSPATQPQGLDRVPSFFQSKYSFGTLIGRRLLATVSVCAPANPFFLHPPPWHRYCFLIFMSDAMPCPSPFFFSFLVQTILRFCCGYASLRAFCGSCFFFCPGLSLLLFPSPICFDDPQL